MEIPVQITFKNMASSEAVERRIREKIGKLEAFSSRVTGCRVVVEAAHHQHRQGNLFTVTVDLTVPPRGEIVAGRTHRRDHAHEDVMVAIRDAFAAAQRQLEDHSRRVRGDVKTHEAPLTGQVTRIFPDYGFVETSDGREIYFHRNAVIASGFDALSPGAEVRLVVAEGGSAAGPQASTVEALG